jgi:hypothetical protein
MSETQETAGSSAQPNGQNGTALPSPASAAAPPPPPPPPLPPAPAAAPQQAVSPASETNLPSPSAPVPTPAMDGLPLDAESVEVLQILNQLSKIPQEKQASAERDLKSKIREVLAAHATMNAPSANGANGASAASAPAAAPSAPVDPGEFSANMVQVEGGIPQLTIEAMDKGAYEFPPGSGKKVFQPVDGLCVDHKELATGEILFAFEVSAPILCQNGKGQFVNVPRGGTMCVYGTHEMRTKLGGLIRYQNAKGGKAHIKMRPTGEFCTKMNGLVEPAWDIRVEPDDADPQKRPAMYRMEAKESTAA